jgi:hypothetical protein
MFFASPNFIVSQSINTEQAQKDMSQEHNDEKENTDKMSANIIFKRKFKRETEHTEDLPDTLATALTLKSVIAGHRLPKLGTCQSSTYDWIEEKLENYDDEEADDLDSNSFQNEIVLDSFDNQKVIWLDANYKKKVLNELLHVTPVETPQVVEKQEKEEDEKEDEDDDSRSDYVEKLSGFQNKGQRLASRLFNDINKIGKQALHSYFLSNEVYFSAHTIRITLPNGYKCLPKADPKSYYTPKWPDQVELQRLHAHVPELYAQAAPAPFGDLETLQTKFDPHIRAAREIPAEYFQLDVGPASAERHTSICEVIREQWCSHFFPNQFIRVIPYKLHIYGPDDHFEPHRDTADLDLVGTVLLNLCMPAKGGRLQLLQVNPSSKKEEKDDDDRFRILVEDGGGQTTKQGWTGFFPDVLHRVTRVEVGYRMTLSFKIYAGIQNVNFNSTEFVDMMMAQTHSTYENPLINSLIPSPLSTKTVRLKLDASKSTEVQFHRRQALEKTNNQIIHHLKALRWLNRDTGFGILLHHLYSIKSTVLKGMDAYLLALIKQLPDVKYKIIPVVIKYHLTSANYDGGREHNNPPDCDILALTQSCVNYAADLTDTQPHEWYDGWTEYIPFYGSWKSGTRWSWNHDKGAEHTGNEAREEELDSVYVCHAILIDPPFAKPPVVCSDQDDDNDDDSSKPSQPVADDLPSKKAKTTLEEKEE